MRHLFVITGNAGHGKDTVCEILRDSWGLDFESSSKMALKLFLFDELRDEYGINYLNIEAAHADRDNNRGLYAKTISRYVKDDKTKLARQIFKENDVYCGIRSIDELNAIRNWASKEKNIKLHVIWVEATNRTQTVESIKSMGICESDCDHVIDNNNGLEQLSFNVVELMVKLGFGYGIHS